MWFIKPRIGTLLNSCPPSSVTATARITIDSHQDGQTISPGLTPFYGTYTDVYEVELIVNGEMVTDVQMDDPDGNDSGDWSYSLDTSQWDGPIEVVLKSKDTGTRYGIWSSFMSLVVDNPAAHIPEVLITGPAERTMLKAKERVNIAVNSKNSITAVELRIDGKEWIPLKSSRDGYTYTWNTRKEAKKIHSLEARATDANRNTGYSPTIYADTRKISSAGELNDAVNDMENDMGIEIDPETADDISLQLDVESMDSVDSVVDSVYESDSVTDSVYEPDSSTEELLAEPSPLLIRIGRYGYGRPLPIIS